MARQVVFILLLFFAVHSAYPGNDAAQNYRNIFNSDYTSALKLLSDNQPVINSTCKKFGIESHFFNAIIFPELIRYSILEDFFETEALKIMYVDHGRECADFSIGYYQMKPSFIEDMEEFIATDRMLKIKYQEILKYKSDDLKSVREERIDRLQSPKWQAVYLCCFIDIVGKKYQDIQFSTFPDQLNFYSSAYNAGFLTGEENILKRVNMKFFPYGAQYKGNQYAYSDISLFYFNNEILKTKKQ